MYVVACLTTAGRVHPENVTVAHGHLRAFVRWDFDVNLARRISGFEVVLAPGQGDPIRQTADKAEKLVTLQHLQPNTVYTPTVTAVYTDNKKVVGEGASFRTPGTLCCTELIHYIHVYYCLLEE